ncbi:uncharacterized protein BDZ99DRAFT_568176 [Mytilinidion resinicola]|uniref:Rhodopsin domain-containing protein n=1 Tax=Mytilinidion resinicola TaxID=574789 RepID=A0A6A6YVA6_9PEZI|nr:uncharacterized protein BDZ99DRAFT_568176 [Mytilinidion resinicola]KAF2812872.1 hypothetical protein BDZ99DRAFT_568176 [Mytilinidion resinicola]
MLMLTQGPDVIYPVSIVLAILDVIAVGLRFYARRRQKQSLRIDDWLIIPALVMMLGMCAAIWWGVASRAVRYPTPALLEARDLVSRTPIDQSNRIITITAKTFFIVITLAIPTLGLIKGSILCFYRRIFCIYGLSRYIPLIAITFMLTIVFTWTVGFFFAYVFGCGTTFDVYWAGAGADIIAKCVDTQMMMYALSLSGFLCDALIILIPIPLVWKLQLSTKKKLAVISIFLTGSLAVVASMIKLIWFVWENEHPFNPNNDQDLIITAFIFWSMVETQAGLLAACLPTLRSLIQGRSMDSVLNSIHSKLSMHSLRSRSRSDTDSTRKGSVTSYDSSPRRSETSQVPFNKNDSETYGNYRTRALHPLDASEVSEDLRRGQIAIDRQYEVEVTDHKV